MPEIPVDRLRRTVKSGNHVAGTHFFPPANVMKLLEMVRSSGTRAGWYRYEKGDRTPHPEVAAIVKKGRY